MTITYNKQVLIKRGNTAGISSYVGPIGELVLNTDTMAVYVQNGVTPGGVLVTDGGSGTYSNVNVNSYLQQFDGNIIPTGNAVHSLGTIDHQWKDLWISNATIYLNSVPLGLDTTGNLTFDGNPLVSVINGVLTLPAGGDIVDSNGTSVLGGGATSSLVNGSFTLSLDSNGIVHIPATPNGSGGGAVIFPSATTGTQAMIDYGADRQGGAFELTNTDGTNRIYMGLNLDGNQIDLAVGIVNGSYKNWYFNADGYLSMESLYLQGFLKGVDGSTGSTGQVLTRQSNGGVAWADSTGGVSTSTRWDATPTEPGNNCPIYAELTPDHFQAFTQQSNLGIRNDGSWNIGSNYNGTGLYGSGHNATLYSNYGDVVIRVNDSQSLFTFGGDGSITFPDNSVQTTAYTGVSSTLVWAARAFSNANASTTQAVAYDSQGNSFALIMQSPWNGPGNSKSTIVKLSSDGTELWSVDIADSNSVNPWSLTCDGDNNLYAIVQRLNGSVYNNVVMKLNGANGSILWQVDIQDSQAANNMQAIAFNISSGFNGVAIAGSVYNGTDNDFFISGIQSDGTPGTVHTWGDQWDQAAYGLAVNNTTGDIVLAGRKQSNTDNAYYLEMVKFNFGGGVVWQKSITVEGNYDVQGTDVCLLADGNWAVVASHNMANGNYGVITMKINNTDGTVMWSREISQGCTNISSSIATDSSGNIYISASTFGGTGTNNVPLVTKIIGAYDTNGSIIWQKYFRSPGDNWVVDNNWWNNIGSTGKTLAVHGNSLLVAASLAPLSPNSGPVNSYGVVAQLSLLGEDETIGIFETRNSYLTDSAVVLTLADTVYDYTTATQTLSAGSTLSTSAGTLTFVIDHAGAQTSQLVNNGKSVSLQPNGILVNEIGRSVTGEFDGVTDSGNNFSNQPIGIRNASGYKRLVGLTNSAQTWFDINTVATQLGVNTGWIMGLTVEYQVTSSGLINNGSMTGQIIIASSNNSSWNISVSHSEAVLTQSNSSNDIVFANLNLWQPSGWTLQAIRTDSNSQQLDIIWTAKVFINASESYC